MRILPSATQPPVTPFGTTHFPQGKNYQSFLACLRWEFGFTCALCLIHESDISRIPGARTGSFSIEHHITQSKERNRATDYSNCIYACGFCNRARGNKSGVSPEGAQLLNPRTHAWGVFFDLVNDNLQPTPRDSLRSEYTRECYDLNDPRKKLLRRRRREEISEALDVLREALPRLIQISGENDLEEARRLRRYIHMAWRSLEQFKIVPPLAPRECGCHIRSSEIPNEIDKQCSDIAPITINPD